MGEETHYARWMEEDRLENEMNKLIDEVKEWASHHTDPKTHTLLERIVVELTNNEHKLNAFRTVHNDMVDKLKDAQDIIEALYLER